MDMLILKYHKHLQVDIFHYMFDAVLMGIKDYELYLNNLNTYNFLMNHLIHFHIFNHYHK